MKTLLATLLGLLCAISGSALPRRQYLIAEPEGLIITDSHASYPSNWSLPYSAIEIRAAAKEPAKKEAGASPVWFDLSCGDLRLHVQRHTAIADDIHDDSALRLTIFSGDSLINTSTPEGLATDGSLNSFLLEWNVSSDTLSLYAGKDRPVLCTRLPFEVPSGAEPVEIDATGSIKVALLVAEEREPTATERLAGLDPQELDSLISRPGLEMPEGVYRYLDRSTNPAAARLGGRYSLAIFRDPKAEGEYVVYYLDGAEVEPQFWQRGMIKGRLRATPFRDQYDLEWVDAHGNPLAASADSYAVVNASEGTLTLAFPTLSDATMRYWRMRLSNE